MNYVPEEETIRNDYSQRYVDTGEWPQNWVLGADPDKRFEEYPKQQRLLALKKSRCGSISRTIVLPPSQCPLHTLAMQIRRDTHRSALLVQLFMG
jgi:mRNA (2'-O-methyladenosine-N6-)-methyltransferase